MVGESRFKKFIWIGLTLIIGITAFMGYEVTNLKFDYNFEKFFPKNDDETDFFYAYRQEFTSDNDFLLIAIENKDGVFDSAFLKDVSNFTDKI